MNVAKTQQRSLVDAADRAVERDGVTHRLFSTPEMVHDHETDIEAALDNER